MSENVGSKLKQWLEDASEEDLLMLEDRSKTIRNLFYQWVNEIRQMSPAKASAVSDAMHFVKSFNKDAPEPVDRGDLCDLCNSCPHFKASKKDAI